MPTEAISPVVNLGSSTLQHRKLDQPHIHREVVAPLEARAIKVLHVDLKPDEGVDIVGDIYTDGVQAEIRSYAPRLVMCCNILEHVVDPANFARICATLLQPSGLMLITVPYSYPFHHDPIDTYYRPSPQQLADLLPEFEPLDMTIIDDATFLDELLASYQGWDLLTYLVKSGVKLFLPFRDFQAWKKRYHRYLWLKRTFKVTCVLLQKPG